MSTKKTNQKLGNTAKSTLPHATKGKNAGGQTNGQFERDSKRAGGRGQFTGAGDAPRMAK